MALLSLTRRLEYFGCWYVNFWDAAFHFLGEAAFQVVILAWMLLHLCLG